MSPADHPKKQLGRGLSALLGDSAAEAVGATTAGAAARGARAIPVAQIRAGRFQPRRFFNPADMDELIASVRAQGVLQPILVRRDPENAAGYELIAGERRWRAAQAAQLHEIPAVVRDLSDREAMEAALVENLQRRDLNPLEEAEAYRRLIDEFRHTQEQIAAAIGKSRPHVANLVRLLDLPDEIKQMLVEGKLTAGHARALLTAKDPLALARAIVGGNLTVRRAEELAGQAKQAVKKRRLAGRGMARDADTLDLERRLAAALGLRAEIRHPKGGQTGSLVIRYKTLDQLDDVLARLFAEKSDR